MRRVRTQIDTIDVETMNKAFAKLTGNQLFFFSVVALASTRAVERTGIIYDSNTSHNNNSKAFLTLVQTFFSNSTEIIPIMNKAPVVFITKNLQIIITVEIHTPPTSDHWDSVYLAWKRLCHCLQNRSLLQ